MLFTAVRRRAIPTCAAALAVALSGPALAGAEVTGSGCPSVATTQPFAPWQDFADYFMAPGGDIEDSAATWDLAGGATAVEGNEPFNVGTAGDHRSLSLPAGSSATTAPMCIGSEHRSLRFFVRGPSSGVVTVQAVYPKRFGKEKAVHLATISATAAWAASDVLPMVVNESADDHANALSVALRFTAHGTGSWQIDDVYVDPYRTG